MILTLIFFFRRTKMRNKIIESAAVCTLMGQSPRAVQIYQIDQAGKRRMQCESKPMEEGRWHIK